MVVDVVAAGRTRTRPLPTGRQRKALPQGEVGLCRSAGTHCRSALSCYCPAPIQLRPWHRPFAETLGQDRLSKFRIASSKYAPEAEDRPIPRPAAQDHPLCGNLYSFLPAGPLLRVRCAHVPPTKEVRELQQSKSWRRAVCFVSCSLLSGPALLDVFFHKPLARGRELPSLLRILFFGRLHEKSPGNILIDGVIHIFWKFLPRRPKSIFKIANVERRQTFLAFEIEGQRDDFLRLRCDFFGQQKFFGRQLPPFCSDGGHLVGK